MDEKALIQFLCSVEGFEKEIILKIFGSNAPCKRCLVIPGPGEFYFIISTEIAQKKTFQNGANKYSTDYKK